MNQPARTEGALALVLDCIAEVLGSDPEQIPPGRRLAALGLESFTAVRLRRRLRERAGQDLPLTAFLGEAATAEGIAARLTAPGGESGETADGSGTGPVEEAGPGEGPDLVAGPDGAEGEPFPLTPIQASYLAGRAEGLPLGGVATFYYYEYDRQVAGTADPLADVTRLETAWNRLVAHHPMLRMTVDDRGRQRILRAPGPYRIHVADLRDASAERVAEQLAALRHESSHRCRPHGTWPLFDLRAALLPDGRTRLHVGVDVLLTDMAGWMLLMRQWGALVADPAHRLPVPEQQFPDLQRTRAADPEWAARRERDREYWAARAATLPPAPALPVLRDPADTTPPRFVRCEDGLDTESWSALRARSAEHGVTPTATLLAAFAFTLARWGAGERICLNTTLFDRPETHGGSTDAVGDFTTTALVGTPPCTPGTWEGFARYAAEVNHRFWEDLDHRSVSGVEVLRDLRGAGTAPATALSHPVVFTSGVGLAGEAEPPAGWLGEEVFGVSQTPQVLLDHIVWDEGGRLRLAWDWVEGAFPDGWIRALLDACVRLLHSLKDPAAWTDRTLGWDPSFRPEEPLDVTPYPTAGPLLHDPVLDAAGRHPSRPALHAPTGTVTHERLAANAGATAELLTAQGVGPGDLVAVACEKGTAQITAVLGISASGAGYVPIEPSWPAARVSAVCERAGVRHALVGRGVHTPWPDGVTVHRLTAAGRPARRNGAGRPAPTAKTPAPDDTSYVIFTSGSTGSPKGVEIQHRAARTTVDDITDRFAVGPDDRVLALSALSFDLSVYDIYGVLGAGGSLVLPDPARQRDPQHWLEEAGRHGVTIWNTAPALLEMLVEYAEMEPEQAATALGTLRLVMLSGDWIPLNLPDRLRRLAPQARFMSLGGATEASIWSITHPVGETDPNWRSIPYGRALRGQSFHVLDEDGAPSPVGTAGELFIGGGGLARGYIGDSAQTEERFTVHPVLGRRVYRTGDMGRWSPDGTIEFLGRVDRQVKIRGHRIELGEIEAVLSRHRAVRQCVVSSVRGPDGRPRLVAHLSPKGTGEPPTPEELAAALRERLPDYMVPARFVLLDHLPVTANGKIDHAALAATAQHVPQPREAADAPAPAVTATRQPLPPGTAAHPAPDTSWIAAALTEADELGLEAALVVRPGSLTAEQALQASATWLRRLRELRGDSWAPPRLTPGGLAEVPCTPPTEPSADSIIARPAAPVRAEVPAARTAPDVGTGPQSAVTAERSARRSGGTVPDPGVLAAVTEVFTRLTDGPVTPGSTFASLGATSLTLVLAHRRLREGPAPRLALSDMFEHPTVASLAARITEQAARPEPRQTAAPHAEPVQGPSEPAPAPQPARPRRRTDRVAARALAEETAR
ncbi:amino acid adenylation domain-containing protein [Streptomyces sp. 549]|uniref:amino acid adenylation domain-containing protein n=1 Tax=Streptomyces sp. 549 TaxID=3049076 RepID=UPI0024C2B2B6|nr:amino acid adenylation domain-containing protein [Streptomyces sp. 549]MDK1474482.1 amino acid adenylation domain-containing protein [Streptomyces sp. 549]